MKINRGSSRVGTTNGAGGSDRTGADDGPTTAVPAVGVRSAGDGPGLAEEFAAEVAR